MSDTVVLLLDTAPRSLLAWRMLRGTWSIGDSSAFEALLRMIEESEKRRSYRCVHVLALVAVGLLLACSRGDREAKGVSPNAVTATERGTSASLPGKSPDSLRASAGAEHVGVAADAVNWDAQTVAGHLTGYGLAAQAVGDVARPMFRVRGQRFRVDGGRAVVEAYFYGDASAVALDNDQLDTIKVMPKGGTMRWEMPARLIVDNNMAVVVLTEDADLRKRIAAALRSALIGSTTAR